MINLKQEQMNDLYKHGRRYIATWRRVYRIDWEQNYKEPCFQMTEVEPLRITKGHYAARGRYHSLTAAEVNSLIGRYFILDENITEYNDKILIAKPYVQGTLWFAYWKESCRICEYAATKERLIEKIEQRV